MSSPQPLFNPQTQSASTDDLSEIVGPVRGSSWYPTTTINNRSHQAVTVVIADTKHSIHDLDFTFGVANQSASLGVGLTKTVTLSSTILPPATFLRVFNGANISLLKGDHRRSHVKDDIPATHPAATVVTKPAAASDGSGGGSGSSSDGSTSGAGDGSITVTDVNEVTGENGGDWYMQQENYITISHRIHRPLIISQQPKTSKTSDASNDIIVWSEHDLKGVPDGATLLVSSNPAGAFRSFFDTWHWVYNKSNQNCYVVITTTKVSLTQVKFLFSVQTVSASVKADIQNTMVANYYRVQPNCALKVYPGCAVSIFDEEHNDVEDGMQVKQNAIITTFDGSNKLVLKFA